MQSIDIHFLIEEAIPTRRRALRLCFVFLIVTWGNVSFGLLLASDNPLVVRKRMIMRVLEERLALSHAAHPQGL